MTTPDPFNGATRLVMAPDVFEALAPELERYASLIRPRIEIEVRPTLPERNAMGFRPWRVGDAPKVAFISETLVWWLAPATQDTSTDRDIHRRVHDATLAALEASARYGHPVSLDCSAAADVWGEIMSWRQTSRALSRA